MSYDIFIKRRLDEIEETILTRADAIEKLHIWFTFAKSFSLESHTLYESQYMEFIDLCKKYSETPDPVARKAIKKQITAVTKEIDNYNAQLKRIPRIQSKLEQAVRGKEEDSGGEKA